MTEKHDIPSYKLICRASEGEKEAIRKILKFYDAYISKVCLRPLYNESGIVNMAVDEELKGEIHTQMIKSILRFEVRIK